MRDPKEFNPKTFRRTDGGTLYSKIKVPKTIAIIWAKLKGKDKSSDPTIAQALRFPVKNWTSDKAKKWLKDNKIKYQKFEPASKSKKKQTADRAAESYRCECIKCGYQKTSNKHCKDLKCPKCGGQMRRVERPGPGQEKNSAPVNACMFDETCLVSFAGDKVDELENNNFQIIVYSGQVIPNHWFWGNVAFDLQGTKFDKSKTAVLEEHLINNRIGFTTKQDVSDKITVEGRFLNNPIAQQIRADMKEGFPMQASMYIPPIEIEHVKEGETAEVNGHKLKGAGTIFRKSIIREVSMCTLGADSHTQSKVFAEGGKDQIQFNIIGKETEMSGEKEQLELTAETFAADYPEIAEEVTATARAEGEKELRQQFEEICELAGEDNAFIVEQFRAGKSVDEAKTALIAKLQKEKAEPPKKDPDPAEQEFSDEQKQTETGKDKDGKPTSWDAAVKQRMKEAECSEADSIRFCVGEYPELHKKFLKGQKKE